MNWNRAKRRQVAQAPTSRLEREADKLLDAHQRLTSDPRKFPSLHEVKTDGPEHVYYRSVGTVMRKGDRWFACGENGLVLGEFAYRWEAWRLADKLGLEQVGA